VAFNDIIYPGYGGFGVVAFSGAAGNQILNSTFLNIGREGVLIYGAGTDATISNNTYMGKGSGNWLDYADITDNTISGNTGVASTDGSTSAGIMVTTFYGSGSQATIVGNTISNSTDAISVGYDNSDTSVVTAHDNRFIGDTNGVNSTAVTKVNATNNWWGDASGPKDTTASDGSQPASNPGGIGSAVVGSVIYSPWYTNANMTSITPASPTNMKFLNGSTVYQCGSGLNSNVTNNLEFVWSDPVGTTIGHRTVMTYPDGTNKTAYTGSLNLWIGNQSKYGYDNGFAEHDQGIYSYTVADENAAGQWSAPAPACTLIYETSIPTATLTQPVPTIVNKNFQVAATASDNVMLQNVFFDVRSQDGSKWVSGCVVGSFNINYTDNNKQASLGCTINTSSLVNGTTYLLRVHASNYAGYGNVNSASQSYFTYDNANLTAPTGGTPNMTSTRNDFYFKWNASTGALAGWPVKYELIASQDKTAVQNADMSKVWDSVRDGAGSGQGNLTTPTDHSTGAGDGVWYWSVRAFDAAGNQSPWSDVWSVTVDNTAPVVSITSPNNGDVVNGTVTVSGTVTDNNPDHYYFVVKDSTGKVVAGPGVVNQANVTSWNWDTTKFTDGIYTIDLEARDAAGNKDANSVQTINVVVDNMKPTVLLDAITSPVGGFTKNLDITGKVNDANLASYQLIATDDATGVVVADTGVIPTTTGGAINPYAWDV
jgi:hypothetical protein